MAAIVALVMLSATSGCAMWNLQNWNPNNYRDARAADIDQRLQKTQPNVPNPF